MSPAPIPFVPLTVLPTQVLWECSDLNHVAPTEAVSDDGSDRSMDDVVEGTEEPLNGASSILTSARVVVPHVSTVPVLDPVVALTANAVLVFFLPKTSLTRQTPLRPQTPLHPLLLLPLLPLSLLPPLRDLPLRCMLVPSRLLVECQWLARPLPGSCWWACYRSALVPGDYVSMAP